MAKGARTKAGMRRLIQEQNQAAAQQVSETAIATPKKIKRQKKSSSPQRNSIDESIDSIILSSALAEEEQESLPMSSPEVPVPKRRGRKKKSESLAPVPVQLRKGQRTKSKSQTRRSPDLEAAHLLLDLKQSPPAKVEIGKKTRRSLSSSSEKEKKISKSSPVAAVSKRRQSQSQLPQSPTPTPTYEHKITRKVNSAGEGSKLKAKVSKPHLLHRRPLNPQKLKAPTVKKKVSTLVSSESPQSTVRTKKSGGGDKAQSLVGPSLKVKHGIVKFYRGSDEEVMDEPPQNTHVPVKVNI